MRKTIVGGALAIAAGALVACGSVSGSDPSFWQPAQGYSGAQARLIAGENYGGAAGVAGPQPTDTNGNPLPPPPGGGGIQGAGGYIPGNGGVQNFSGAPNNSGGAPPFGGAPPGSGGFVDNSGGFVGAGGGQPPPGAGGDPNPPPTTTGPPPPPPPPVGKCTFRFDVTTVSYGGRFRPQNVGAIYIETASGAYVKSLNVWGATRLGNLTDWQALSAGDKTDAVSSATRGNAGPISGNWDCTDKTRNPVPGGDYKVCCSIQEDDAFPFFGPAPKQACAPFSLGSGSPPAAIPNQQYFTNMSITLQ